MVWSITRFVFKPGDFSAVGGGKGKRGKNVEKSGMQTGTEAGRKTGIDSRRHKQCSGEEGGVKNQAGGVVVVVGGCRLYF